MKLTIRNHNTDLNSEKFDIIIPCEVSLCQKISYVDFEFEEKENQSITGKFLLNGDAEDLSEFNFYHFKNTKLIAKGLLSWFLNFTTPTTASHRSSWLKRQSHESYRCPISVWNHRSVPQRVKGTKNNFPM